MGSPPFLIFGPCGSPSRLWLAGGQCYKAEVTVPCCQRLPRPAGSQTVRVCARASMCIYVSVCQVQYSPYAIKTLFSRWHAAGLLKYLKWFRFTNILKICLGQPDMKRWLPNLSSSRKAMRLSARFVIWAIPHEFPNIFKYIFLIWSRLCIFMPPPK